MFLFTNVKKKMKNICLNTAIGLTAFIQSRLCFADIPDPFSGSGTTDGDITTLQNQVKTALTAAGRGVVILLKPIGVYLIFKAICEMARGNTQMRRHSPVSLFIWGSILMTDCLVLKIICATMSKLGVWPEAVAVIEKIASVSMW